MESYNNIINFSIIAIGIIIFIHVLFKNQEQMKQLSLQKLKPDKKNHIIENDDISTDSTDLLSNYSSPESSVKGYEQDEFNERGNLGFELSNAYPIAKDVSDSKYLDKLMIKEKETCGKVPKTRKEFNKDFFNFRDRVWHSSSMRYDPVDKIKDMYLSGNISEARRYPNMKIQDLYDELTSGTNLYKRQCVRAPLFDNMNPDGYFVKPGSPGTILTGNTWNYDNEKVMNGGKITQDLTGNFQ